MNFCWGSVLRVLKFAPGLGLRPRSSVPCSMQALTLTSGATQRALDPARQAACSYVSDTINYHNIEMSNDTCSGIEFLSEKLKELQAQTIDNINDLYTKKVLLEAKMVYA